MLPCLQKYNALPIVFDFNQNLVTDLMTGTGEEASAVKQGACVGISLIWIHCHSQGRVDNFFNQIRSGNLVTSIFNIQKTSNIFGKTRYDVAKYARENNYINLEPQPDMVIIPRNIGYDYAAEVINQQEGYLLLTYKFLNSIKAHTVAIFNTRYMCEFFDPNYGSARFPNKRDFIPWFGEYAAQAILNGDGSPAECDHWDILRLLIPNNNS